MKLYIRSALTPQEYNDRQSELGSTLKTYKGSAIKRSNKYGVGKEIGGDIYFQKDYADISLEYMQDHREARNCSPGCTFD